jgi:FKBP-type peptidyl-prolyl cis-trans isomerase FklB
MGRRPSIHDPLETILAEIQISLCHHNTNTRKLSDKGMGQESRIAFTFNECENEEMKKTIIATLAIMTAGMMLASHAKAQQTPTSSAPQTPTTNSPAVPAKKSGQAPAAKTGGAPGAKSPAVLALKTLKDKNSYAFGMNIGRGLRQNSVDIDPAILMRGIKDALAGGKTLLTDEEAQAMLTAIQNDLRKKQQDMRQQAGDTNKKEGEAFLAENKTKDSVITLSSGLQYKIVKAGDGPKPAATDSVVCNYRGTLINGTEFDSSYKRGQPITFPVGQVIKGWTEALQLMPVGSKWELYVPPDLAYGDRGSGPNIGPNATLIFEVELLSIQGKDAK